MNGLNDKIVLILSSLLTGVVLALLGHYLLKPKTKAETERTISETENNREKLITELRKQISDSQQQKLEVLEKLDVWIARFQNAKEEGYQRDNKLEKTLEELADCLENKDEKCKKCLQKVTKIFRKIELSLLGVPEYQSLLEEMWLLQKDLEGESNE